MKKNDKIIGTCLNYTFEGMGVVKHEGFPVFVKDMLVGEVGEIVITLVKKTYAYGRLLNLYDRSEERVEAKCPIFKKCGGCQIQHMSVKEQAQFKKQRVQEVIHRIGKLDLEVEDILTMDNPYYYRNKGQVPVGIDKGSVVTGFYRINSNQIIDMKECMIQSPKINDIVSKMKELLVKYEVPDIFRHILVKHAFATNQVMVVWIVKDRKWTHQKEMLDDLLKAFPEIKTVIVNVNQRNDNVILGEKEYILYGDGKITDKLGDLSFLISSKSFYQVNPVQTKVLYSKVVEFAQLNGSEEVLDLYCGVGTISLHLAKSAKHVTGIEIIPDAIKDALENAKLNSIENVSFLCSDAAKYATQLVKENKKVDVIVVDPPRKGCDEETIQSMIKMNPDKIVYVSCDPSTLARDLNRLNTLGYITKKVLPVDQFPNTFHVESVCLIERK